MKQAALFLPVLIFCNSCLFVKMIGPSPMYEAKLDNSKAIIESAYFYFLQTYPEYKIEINDTTQSWKLYKRTNIYYPSYNIHKDVKDFFIQLPDATVFFNCSTSDREDFRIFAVNFIRLDNVNNPNLYTLSRREERKIISVFETEIMTKFRSIIDMVEDLNHDRQ